MPQFPASVGNPYSCSAEIPRKGSHVSVIIPPLRTNVFVAAPALS